VLLKSRRRRLSSERAGEVEAQLRTRSEQLKPKGTALGLCRACGEVVYAGHALAMLGAHVQHADCTAGDPDRQIEPT
jgi:hypothetical protein